MLKLFKIIIFILTAKVAICTQHKMERIDLMKYVIANELFLYNKVFKFHIYSNVHVTPEFTTEYDSLGRIMYHYNPFKEGFENSYERKNDTLKVTRYENDKRNIKQLNQIEYFVYQFKKIKRYISISKEIKINYELLEKSNITSKTDFRDTVINLVHDIAFYDSKSRIVKIEHYHKFLSNTDLVNVFNFQVKNVDFKSVDTIIYNRKGRIKLMKRYDNKNYLRISEQIKYDNKDRIQYRETTWHGNWYNADVNRVYNSVEKIHYIYKFNKTISIITRSNSGNNLPKPVQNITTTFFDKNGLEIMKVGNRDMANAYDTITFKYEFYK